MFSIGEFSRGAAPTNSATRHRMIKQKVKGRRAGRVRPIVCSL